MTSPEKGQLTFFYNPEGTIRSIILNPELFTLDAMRTILWTHAESENPKNIAIHTKAILHGKENAVVFLIPSETLLLTKRLNRKDCSGIISKWAKIMKNAHHVVISTPLPIR